MASAVRFLDATNSFGPLNAYIRILNMAADMASVTVVAMLSHCFVRNIILLQDVGLIRRDGKSFKLPDDLASRVRLLRAAK